MRGRTRLLVLVLCAAAAAAVMGWWWSRPPLSLEDLPQEAQGEFKSRLEKAAERIDLRQWEEAEADLQRCLSIFDGDPGIHASLAKVYMGMRLGADPARVTEDEEDALVDRALAEIDLALAIDAEHVPALKERFNIRRVAPMRRYDPNGALADAKEILRLSPEEQTFQQFLGPWLLGEVRFRRERKGGLEFDSAIGTEEAARFSEGVLDRSPVGSDLYAQALQGLGVVYVYMGDFERAIETMEKLHAQALEGKIKARNLQNLGFANYRLGRYGKAAGHYLRSIEGWNTIEARWLLRLAYEGMGRDVGDLPEKYRFVLPREEIDPASPPKLRFTEKGEALGVAKVDGAGPSAFADFDGDGDADILAVGCDTFTALYRNDGDRFVDVTIDAGLFEMQSGFSANLIDYDNDGDLDIYICRDGWSGPARNILYRNRGDGTFEDRSAESGLDDGGSGFVSLWADFDRDGDLDVYMANGVINDGSTNRLYRNRGDGTFEDATEGAGLGESRRWGTIGIAVGDYDRDGDPDIFVNGRWDAPNRLYRNRGDGKFEEVAGEAGVTGPRHNGYTAFFLDYNNDAHPDILVTSLARWVYVLKGSARLVVPTRPEEVQSQAPRLYRNDGDGSFTDVTLGAGIAYPLGIMGANVGDLDNDGYVDLYLGTGNPALVRLEPSIFYHNNGDGTFHDLTRFTGLGHLGKGHGFTFADYDGDGDLDIYAPQGGFFHGDLWANPFYENEAGSENHWFHLRLRGTESNRFAVGAQVTLRSGGTLQYREVTGGIGFGSTNSYPVEFGLGERDSVDEVEIIWPSGLKQVLKSPPVDSLIEVVEDKDSYEIIHTGRKT